MPKAPSATRSAASGSSGSSTVIVTGSAAGCSSSRTIMWPAWAVDRQWTRRRASPGTYGRAPRGSPTSDRGRSRTSPVPSSGRRGTGCALPQRGDTCSAAGRGSCTRLVHHCSPNGAAEAMSRVTASWTPRRTGTNVMTPSTAPRRPAGPTNASGPGGSTGRTRTRLRDSTCTSTGRPAMPSPGALRRVIRARVATTKGPTIPMRRAPKTRSPSTCTQPGARVVGNQPPQADDQRRPRPSAPTGGPAAPSGSRSGRWGRFEKLPDHRGRLRGVAVGLDGEDAVRQAVDGHRLHVVGHHVGPGREDGVGLRGAEEPDGGPRARADVHAGRGPAGRGRAPPRRRPPRPARARTPSPAAHAAIPRACRPDGVRPVRTCRRDGAPAAPPPPRRGTRWPSPWRNDRAGSRRAGRCRAANTGSAWR